MTEKPWYAKPQFYVPGTIVIIMFALIGSLFIPNSQTPARLDHIKGTVEVNTGEGYAPAADDLELDESDSLRTGADGTATLILYETILVRLEENTEITITELAGDEQRITQQQGSVWSKIARLGGTYSVETTNTVATVRGTTLRTRNAELYELLVAEGIVNAQTGDERFMVGAREKLVGTDGTYNKQNLTAEDIAQIRAQLEFELWALRELRLREVLKNDMAMTIARNKYDATDKDVEEYLLAIDEGRASEQDIRSGAPVITEDVKRIFIYNSEIRKTLEAIEEYS